MLRRVVYVLATLAATGQTARATMTFEEIRPDKPIFYDLGSRPLPKEIRDCANSPGRVFATVESWSGGYEYRTVYFRGNVATLNEQLEKIASFSGVPVLKGLPRVIIHDDERPRRTYSFHQIETPEFDWRLHFDTHIQIGGPNGGELDATVYAEVWIGGAVALDQLKIPQQLRVQAASRVEKYADDHEVTRLGSREALLEQRIRDLQDKLAIEKRRQAWAASTRPAQSQPHASSMPAASSVK